MLKTPTTTTTSERKRRDASSSGTDGPQAEIRSVELREKISSLVSDVVGQNTNKSVQLTEQIVEIVAEESFKGPVPHPKHLAHYEQICPGLAERMMVMAETDHSRSLDLREKLVDYEYRDRKTGMWLGFMALIFLISAGTVTTIFGNKYIGGGLLATSALGAVISPFVNGRRSLPTFRSIQQAKTEKTQGGSPANAAAKGASRRRRQKK